MKFQRLKQAAVSLCVALSLFASTIAACVCHASAMSESHCEPPPAHESKAENHSHDTHEPNDSTHHESSQAHHHETTSTDEFSINVSFEECCCVQSAPRVFAKSETIKIEKQTANHQPNAPPINNSFVLIGKVETIDFAKPFYLSDSFYNLKSPRAPPRL